MPSQRGHCRPDALPPAIQVTVIERRCRLIGQTIGMSPEHLFPTSGTLGGGRRRHKIQRSPTCDRGQTGTYGRSWACNCQRLIATPRRLGQARLLLGDHLRGRKTASAHCAYGDCVASRPASGHLGRSDAGRSACEILGAGPGGTALNSRRGRRPWPLAVVRLGGRSLPPSLVCGQTTARAA
jgi:hypothetical protein